MKYERVYWKRENSNPQQTQGLLDRCVENRARPLWGVKGECSDKYIGRSFEDSGYWGVGNSNETAMWKGFPDKDIEFHPEIFIDPLSPTDDELLVYESLYGEFPEILLKKLGAE